MSNAKETCTLGALLSRLRIIKEKDDPPFEAERFTQGPAPTKAGQGVPYKRLKWPSHFGTNHWLSNMERADWQHVDMWLAYWSAKFITKAQQLEVPLFVHGAFRTRQEQDSLLAEQRTKARWPRAPHCQGKAVDIIHSRYAWDLSEDEWAWLGYTGLEMAYQINSALPKEDRVELEWGGSWSFYDPAHWEIKNWREDVIELPSFPHTPRTVVKNLRLAKEYDRLKGRRLPPNRVAHI